MRPASRLSALPVLGAALLVLGLGPVAHAGADVEPAGLDALVRDLGSPPSAEAVARLVERALSADVGDVAHAARGLAFSGGLEAARGLLVLLGHADAQARAAVLGAVVELGLRCDRLTERIRRVAEEERGPDGEAAVRALGWVGDGRDMDFLLARADAEDATVRVVAFRAMARLTDASIPYDRPRWAHYWKTFRMRATLMLPQTLMAITMAPSEPDAATLVELVRNYGWADLPAVRDTLSAWLVDPEHDLRALACVLAAELRLVDLVPDLEQALNFAMGQRWEAEARAAVQKLGGRLPDVRAPTR